MDSFRRGHLKISYDRPPYELKDLLIHNVMYYILPPLNDITLYEFEVSFIWIFNLSRPQFFERFCGGDEFY